MIVFLSPQFMSRLTCVQKLRYNGKFEISDVDAFDEYGSCIIFTNVL